MNEGKEIILSPEAKAAALRVLADHCDGLLKTALLEGNLTSVRHWKAEAAEYRRKATEFAVGFVNTP